MNTDRVLADGTILAVSLELSPSQWKVAFHDGLREKPAIHSVGTAPADARLQAVVELIEQQKGHGHPLIYMAKIDAVQSHI
ncbi:hypothetical protein [Paraburkholderia franconis]|uniref:hypothetical protein n=1 Tax=Paraburkholderia franconis TaxID=2654983 RepID=UPI00187B8270|nr:hypothetical protein [Paraburkholderia franconis]